MPRLWYCNAWFDTVLAGGLTPQLASLCDEMTLWFMLAAEPGDTVLTHLEPPSDWLEYLANSGIEPPDWIVAQSGYLDPSTLKQPLPVSELVPWGWDHKAVSLCETLKLSPPSFSADLVRTVNSRAFSFELAIKLDNGVAGARLCLSKADACAAAESLSDAPFVVKPAFGSTGIGFVRGGPEVPLQRTLGLISRLFEQGTPCVTVEPWLNRILDFSARMTVEPNGAPQQLAIYRTLTTSRGAFFGIGLSPTSADCEIPSWTSRVRNNATAVCQALAEYGYRGPATVDGLLAQGADGKVSCVPLLEINARYSMSRIATRIHERLAPGHYALFRTIGAARTTIATDYTSLCAQLGTCVWNPTTHTGTLVLSPVHINGVPPKRALLFLAAPSPEQLTQLNSEVTLRINRAHCGGCS